MDVHSPYYAKELLLRVSRGDQQAFTELFNKYRDKIYTVGIKITRSPEAAEELVQEVFLKIWLLRDRLTDIEDFEGYLFIITRNQAFKVIKKLAKVFAVLPMADETGTDTDILHRDYTRILQRAVERLSSQQKQVYKLIKEQGLTREQVAAQLGLSPETIKTHLAQAMKSIRAYCMAHIDLCIAGVIIVAAQ